MNAAQRCSPYNPKSLTHLGSRIFNGDTSKVDEESDAQPRVNDIKSQNTVSRKFKEYTPMRKLSQTKIAPNRYNSVQKSYHEGKILKDLDNDGRREKHIKEFSKLAEYGNVRRNYLIYENNSNTQEVKQTYIN